jgi:hypothetical protein
MPGKQAKVVTPPMLKRILRRVSRSSFPARDRAMSLRIRKRVEEAFGWIKTVAGQERTKFRGRARVGWAFAFAASAYNLVRLPKLLEAA